MIFNVYYSHSAVLCYEPGKGFPQCHLRAMLYLSLNKILSFYALTTTTNTPPAFTKCYPSENLNPQDIESSILSLTVNTLLRWYHGCITKTGQHFPRWVSINKFLMTHRACTLKSFMYIWYLLWLSWLNACWICAHMNMNKILYRYGSTALSWFY